MRPCSDFMASAVRAYRQPLHRVIEVHAGACDLRRAFDRTARYVALPPGDAQAHTRHGWDGGLYDALVCDAPAPDTGALPQWEGVLRDLRACLPLVRPGGLVVVSCTADTEDLLDVTGRAACRGKAIDFWWARGSLGTRYSGQRMGPLECLRTTGLQHQPECEHSTSHDAGADGIVHLCRVLVPGAADVVGRGPTPAAAAGQALVLLGLQRRLG